jgi:hypothetical protein
MKASSLAYFAYVFSIVTSFEWDLGTNPRTPFHNKLRLRNVTFLFGYVREAIQQLKERPSEELIGAVLVLGTVPQNAVPSRKLCKESRFHSPLAKAQLCDYYGLFRFPATHWAACVQMLRLRGGIHNIESKGLAGSCQL